MILPLWKSQAWLNYEFMHSIVVLHNVTEHDFVQKFMMQISEYLLLPANRSIHNIYIG